MEETLETILDTIAEYEVKHAENQALLAKQNQQSPTEQLQQQTPQQVPYPVGFTIQSLVLQ